MADLTVEILRESRDEIRATRVDLSTRLDRVVQEQIRHAIGIVALEAGQRELVGEVQALHHEVQALHHEVARFEQKTG